MRKILGFLTLVLAFVPCISRASQIVGPSDLEIAQYPIEVIGYWPDADQVKITPGFGDLVGGSSGFLTNLTITKVIKGNVSIGTQILLATNYVKWKKDGRLLNSSFSYSYIQDISKPNIWFLKRSKVQNSLDQAEYLTIDSQCCVQSENLLPLYKALASPNRETEIIPCLRSDDKMVVERALDFISDKKWPWPLSSDDSQFPDNYYHYEPPKIVVKHVDELRALVVNKKSQCRPYATALLGDMVGAEETTFMRDLLKDEDQNVRVMASCFLTRWGDFKSAGRMLKAVQGFSEPHIACELLYAMRKSKRTEYLPIFFSFLDVDTIGGSTGNTYQIPAIYAQKALNDLTGFTFPLDSESSTSAWESTIKFPQPKRIQKLKEMFSSWKDPLVITCSPILTKNGNLTPVDVKTSLNRDYVKAKISIENTSDVNLAISRFPTVVEVRGKSAYSSGGTGFENDEVVVISPHQTLTVEFGIPSFAFSPEGSITFYYAKSGHKQGKKSWMGAVKVKILAISVSKVDHSKN